MDREDILNKYFENQLSESEKGEFELLLSQDPILAEEFEFRKSVKEAIFSDERAKIKNQLKQFESEAIAPVKRLKVTQWMSVAAAIVLLFGASLWYFGKINSTEKLFAEYYQRFPNIEQPLVRGESSTKTGEAFIAYENQDFRKALDIFSTQQDDVSVFYAGVCALELSSFDSALKYFSSLEDREFSLKLYAKWYKALTLLKLNKKEAAKAVLQELENVKEFELSQQVKSLLIELR